MSRGLCQDLDNRVLIRTSWCWSSHKYIFKKVSRQFLLSTWEIILLDKFLKCANIISSVNAF